MMTKAQKITLAIIIAIILLLIIAIASFIGSGNVRLSNEKKETDNELTAPNEALIKKQKEDAASETQKLIDEVKEIAEKTKKENEGELASEGIGKIISRPVSNDGTASSTGEDTREAIVITPGSNMVDVDTGEVLNDDGEVLDNSLDADDPNSPKQSFTIENPGELPSSMVKLKISEGNIEPAEFTVKAGQVVSVAVTASPDHGEIFRFDSKDLSGISVGVGPEETRSVTFNAPKTPGEYVYFSFSRKQRQNGAVGVMIVE